MTHGPDPLPPRADNGSSSMAGWRGGITTPDNLLWALTVLLVSFQVYRYGPRWWAGAISTFSKWANPVRANPKPKRKYRVRPLSCGWIWSVSVF